MQGAWGVEERHEFLSLLGSGRASWRRQHLHRCEGTSRLKRKCVGSMVPGTLWQLNLPDGCGPAVTAALVAVLFLLAFTAR